MSEDRLERALQEMKQEDIDAETLESARARVWNEVASAAGASCAEFRPDLPAYLGGGLGDSRRVLMEDHLEPLPRMPCHDGRDEGRTAGDRHAAARLAALGPMGIAGRGSRTAARRRVRRARPDRRHDGSRRSAGHGRLGRRRPVPPARGNARRPARRLARRTWSAPDRGRTPCCGSPTDRSWTSTSGRSCS